MPTRQYLMGGKVLCHAYAKARELNILIENDQIIDVLPARTKVQDAQPVDVSGKLIHPGLVNPHTHGHATLTKGMADRWSLELLLTAGPSINNNRRLQDKYLSTLLGAAELALKGCTAVYDITFEMPLPTLEGIFANGQAYSDIGIRAVIAPMVSDIHFFQAIPGLMERLPPEVQKQYTGLSSPTQAIMSCMQDMLKQWPANLPLIKPALGPTIPLHCSKALWQGCINLAKEYNLGIQTHLLETKLQALAGLERYGKTITAYLKELGALDLGRNFVAAHGVWLNDDDMDMLGQAGVTVAHNPGSNMILGSGLADVRRMLEHGINVAIGTDSPNCSDNLNMYENMREALRISHIVTPETQKWLGAAEIFAMATENGAQALGIKNIGRISQGFQADLVFLDMSHPNWLPVNDVVTQLVQGEDGTAVHSVMVAGRWVVKDRRLVNRQLGQLREQVQSTVAYLAQQNKQDKALFNRLCPIVAGFCPAFMHAPYDVERLTPASETAVSKSRKT